MFIKTGSKKSGIAKAGFNLSVWVTGFTSISKIDSKKEIDF